LISKRAAGQETRRLFRHPDPARTLRSMVEAERTLATGSSRRSAAPTRDCSATRGFYRLPPAAGRRRFHHLPWIRSLQTGFLKPETRTPRPPLGLLEAPNRQISRKQLIESWRTVDKDHVIDVASEQHLTEREFESLRDLIYGACGIALIPAKKTMMELRLRRRLQALQMVSFREYQQYLAGRGGERELIALIDVITTNKTDFYREPGHFDFLTRAVLPALTAGSGRPLNVWSAGCSSGEEPYTLAMVLSEYAEERPGFQFSILATDISTRVLEKARLGVYEIGVIAPIPPEAKRKYLLKSRDRSRPMARVAPEIRSRVDFQRLNLMDADFALPHPMDVIFCRNVVIYFDKTTQGQLIKKFFRNLRPNGYLFMGHSETLHGFDVPLAQVAPTVYRKTGAVL
jgi:chemotaxis protein methyltransferase CheR